MRKSENDRKRENGIDAVQWILDTTVIFRLSENWCSSEIDVVLRFDLRRPENNI